MKKLISILLVRSKLDKEQEDYLASLKSPVFTVIGGDAAVSQVMETRIKTYGTVSER